MTSTTSAMYTIIRTVAGIASVASAALGIKADTVSPRTTLSRRSLGFVILSPSRVSIVPTLYNPSLSRLVLILS